MANVTLTVLKADQDGATVSSTSMSTSDTYFAANSGRTVLIFRKTGAGAATITLVTQQTVGGLAVADQTVTVPASTGHIAVGLKRTSLFNNAAGQVVFTTDEATGLTVYAVEVEG